MNGEPNKHPAIAEARGVTENQTPAGPGSAQTVTYHTASPVQQRPAVWPVVLVGLLCWPLGWIPARVQSSTARFVGYSVKPYWLAWIFCAAPLLFGLVVNVLASGH